MKKYFILLVFLLVGFLFYSVNSFAVTYKVEWSTTYNSPNNSEDRSKAITVDNDENVYIAGYENRSDLG